MSSEDPECERCGHCCIIPLSVYLEGTEVRAKKFKAAYYSKKRAAWILRKKFKYIPELKKKVRVCFYYDPESHLCSIHEDKPENCRTFNCRTDQKKYIEDWMEALKQ